MHERLSSDSIIGIWATSKKMKLNLCLTANKTKRTKIENKLIELQGERLLFSRCAIVSNSDRDLDMVSVIGDYELDVIPRSLMTADGSLHPGCDNKSDLVECISALLMVIQVFRVLPLLHRATIALLSLMQW